MQLSMNTTEGQQIVSAGKDLTIYLVVEVIRLLTEMKLL